MLNLDTELKITPKNRDTIQALRKEQKSDVKS